MFSNLPKVKWHLLCMVEAARLNCGKYLQGSWARAGRVRRREEIAEAGLTLVRKVPLTGGIVTLWVIRKV